ncbi:MAG TPA: hypothetical protein VL422_18165 [Miltoncostaea sp.]|nr:hypothetical protein [Miltoncostaea sp.]
MIRILRATLAAAAVTAAFAVPASAATWTPVSGLIPAGATAATLDGPRVLVAATSASGKRAVVATIAGGRVARTETIPLGTSTGTVRFLQVASLPGGRSLAVWQGTDGVLASLRPSATARFAPAQTISTFAGATTGAARIPALAVTTNGEPVVVWWGGPEGRTPANWASSMASDGTWDAPVDITSGTYPTRWIGGSGPTQQELAIAPDPAGGLVAAWIGREQISLGNLIAGAARSPSGQWGPVADLGVADSDPPVPAVVAPAPGVVLGAWADWSYRRYPSPGCVTSGVLGGDSVTPADVMCGDRLRPFDVRMVPTGDGGALLAATLGDPAIGTGIQSISTLGRTGTWTPSTVAIARPGRMAGLVPTTGDRAALVTATDTLSLKDAVRVALVRANGTVQRRIGGPGRPARTLGRVQVLPLGPGARVALLLTPTTSTGLRPPWRARILTIGPG